MKNLFYIALVICLANSTFAQAVPVPGEPQANSITFTNATIHVGNGEVIENGSITFDDGKITNIGTGIQASGTVYNASGKHIYPGLIATNTIVGLSEVEALRQTRDFDEAGVLNPNVRSIIAYNTDSRVTPTLRSNGILMAQIAPRGGRISGSSSVVQLDAWNWEDAAYKTDDGVYLNWPGSYYYSGWWAQPGSFKENEEYSNELAEIEAYFAQAKAYAEGDISTENLRFEGMEGLFTGNKQLFIRVNDAQEIISAVKFAQSFHLKPIIVGGADSYLITDFLVENDISVILDAIHRTPSFDDDAIHLPYETPTILEKAGVNFCLTYADFWQVRNLPFQAGTAVAHGLDKEKGLEAVTLSAAKILGIDDTTGSLEIGKDATLLITEGDLLDMATSNVLDAYIQGRQVDLGNKQKDLYKKFSEKYGHEVELPSIK